MEKIGEEFCATCACHWPGERLLSQLTLFQEVPIKNPFPIVFSLWKERNSLFGASRRWEDSRWKDAKIWRKYFEISCRWVSLVTDRDFRGNFFVEQNGGLVSVSVSSVGVSDSGGDLWRGPLRQRNKCNEAYDSETRRRAMSESSEKMFGVPCPSSAGVHGLRHG